MRDLLIYLRAVCYYKTDPCSHVVYQHNVLRNDHAEIDNKHYVGCSWEISNEISPHANYMLGYYEQFDPQV